MFFLHNSTSNHIQCKNTSLEVHQTEHSEYVLVFGRNLISTIANGQGEQKILDVKPRGPRHKNFNGKLKPLEQSHRSMLFLKLDVRNMYGKG
jgi:hypothetical protein